MEGFDLDDLTVMCAIGKHVNRNRNIVWEWFEVVDSLVYCDCSAVFVVGGPVVGEMVNKIGLGVIVGVPLAYVAMLWSPSTKGFSQLPWMMF